MKVLNLFKSLMFVMVCFFSSMATAATEVEEEKLRIVADELDYLQRLVADAQRYASEGDERRFEYKKLLWDLAEIKLAISRHVDNPSNKPREIKELSLEY